MLACVWRMVVAGLEVTDPTSRQIRVQGRPRRSTVVPGCPPGPLLQGVEDELAVHDVGQASLQTSQCLEWGLAGGELASVVGPLLCQEARGSVVLGLALAGPGSDLSEEPVWGCEPAALD